MNALRRVLTNAVMLLLTLSTAAAVHAQVYPDKPVTIIVDTAPGAAPDVDARFVAEGLSKVWGQQVVIINRPGANGSIAARAATEVVLDGYTLFMPALSTFVAPPTVAPNVPLKLPRDFLRSATRRKTRCSSPSIHRSASTRSRS
jgi:tripartite-type tricarboxylate transporter receptor subunit TctC